MTTALRAGPSGPLASLVASMGLNAVLSVDNKTLGKNIEISSGDSIVTPDGTLGGDGGILPIQCGVGDGAGNTGALVLQPTSGRVGVGTFLPTSLLHVSSSAADTTAVTTTTTTGANGAESRVFVGARDPTGLVVGNPGDLYRRVEGLDSQLLINNGAAPGTAWRPTKLRDGAITRDVFTTADFGTAVLAPDGEMRVPLLANTSYIVHGAVVAPLFLVPIALDANIPNWITIIGDDALTRILFPDDSAPAFWGRDSESLFLEKLIAIDISNVGAGRGVNLFNLVGPGGASGQVNIFQCQFVAFKSFGEFVDVTVLNQAAQYLFLESGGTIRINPLAEVLGVTAVNVINAAAIGNGFLPDMRRPAWSLIGSIGGSAFTHYTTALGKPANSGFYVDPTATLGVAMAVIAYTSTATHGEFFRPVLATAVTAQSNEDVVITSFSDSAVNPGVDTTVNFGSIVDVTRGQVILIADEAAYDGLQTVVRVAADQLSFDINVAFSTSGAGTLKQTRHTVANNQFARDETVVVTGTTDYNGTFQVLRGTDTTFDLPQAFVSSPQAGTATSTSQDETSIFVDVQIAQAQANSRTIGSMHVNSNTTDTIIANEDEWTDANFDGGGVASCNIERFAVTDADTGELEYLGLNSFSGVAVVSITGSGQTGQDDYEFRVVINGAPISDAIVAGTSTNQNMRNIGLVVPLELVTGDLARIQVQNTSGTDDWTFENVSINIQ